MNCGYLNGFMYVDASITSWTNAETNADQVNKFEEQDQSQSKHVDKYLNISSWFLLGPRMGVIYVMK